MAHSTGTWEGSAGARLRARMDRGCVAAPGAFGALCARSIVRAGFEACYVSGAATSVLAGVPDIGLLTLDHFARTVREVCEASRDSGGRPVPVLADADTGFGEEEMVRRTVVEYWRAGAAGLHIEDQVFPKRCGHLDGKALISQEHACSKVLWASRAAAELGDGSMVVCARTDARGVEGMERAIERARAYVDAGASMIFPEGLQSEAEFEAFARAMAGAGARKPGPYLLANMTEFGKTPMIPLARFAALGYSMVIYPVTLLRVAMGAVERALDELRTRGSAEGLLGSMQTRKDLYASIGYEPSKPWECPIPGGSR